MHLPPGFAGLIVGVMTFFAIMTLAYLTRETGPFHLDPRGERNAFEPFLTRYIRASEYVIGLATGSIVLLVGSSALRGQGGHLPPFYASPLLLLACCVVFGIAFMVWLIFHYEDYQHGAPHTRFAYALSLALGFTSLACFCMGYVWLIVRVTENN
jgi:hypothetical protein